MYLCKDFFLQLECIFSNLIIPLSDEKKFINDAKTYSNLKKTCQKTFKENNFKDFVQNINIADNKFKKLLEKTAYMIEQQEKFADKELPDLIQNLRHSTACVLKCTPNNLKTYINADYTT